MFKDLTNFSIKRDFKKAVGFYIAYLILGFLLGALFGVLIGLIYPYNEDLPYLVGTVVGTIYCIVLYFIIYFKKKLSSFRYVILGVIAAVINLFLGNIASLLFVAFLTTRANNSEITDENVSNFDV